MLQKHRYEGQVRFLRRILSNISINKQHRNRSEYEEILFMDHAHDPMGHEWETVRGY